MNISFKKLNKDTQERYSESKYESLKWVLNLDFNEYLNCDCTVMQAVYTEYNDIEHRINENGMEKFIAMLCGMLFMMEKGDVYPDHAAKTYSNILDFETGEYDDKFDPASLVGIRNDIESVKTYLVDHPDIIEVAVRERKKAQGLL